MSRVVSRLTSCGKYLLTEGTSYSKVLPTFNQFPNGFKTPAGRISGLTLPGESLSGFVYASPITASRCTVRKPFELPEAFNFFSNTWISPNIDIDSLDIPVIPSIIPTREILEPETDNAAIQCKMHQGRNVKRLRRIRMRRHRYVKWLKRMRFKLRKIRFEREKKKAKSFQDQLDGITKTAESFNPEEFIKDQIILARKGGYKFDIQSDLQKFLISSDMKK